MPTDACMRAPCAVCSAALRAFSGGLPTGAVAMQGMMQGMSLVPTGVRHAQAQALGRCL